MPPHDIHHFWIYTKKQSRHHPRNAIRKIENTNILANTAKLIQSNTGELIVWQIWNEINRSMSGNTVSMH